MYFVAVMYVVYIYIYLDICLQLNDRYLQKDAVSAKIKRDLLYIVMDE